MSNINQNNLYSFCSTLECQTHKNSPIMFICLDNKCNQKLHCFKCCQEYKKDHNFIKSTDFFQNLYQYIQDPSFQEDINHIDVNSTQISNNSLQGQGGDETANLVNQCVKGVNLDFRNGKIWEECEQIKEEFKKMQKQYIDQLFDNQVQFINMMLEKAKESILNKYSEYLDQILNVNSIMSKCQDNLVLKKVFEISKNESNDHYNQLNEILVSLHQGQMHINFYKPKINQKTSELNVKMDEFFAQIQNRITFSLNTCNQLLQTKCTINEQPGISKSFNQNGKQQHHYSDFRFSLKQQPNFNKIQSGQQSQQSSLFQSGQSTGIGGVSPRLSFRIKNLDQKKIDNYHSLSPSNQQLQQLKNSNQFQGFQTHQHQSIQYQNQDANLISKSGSPKSQQINLYNNQSKPMKQINIHVSEITRADSDRDYQKSQMPSQKMNDGKNKICIDDSIQRRFSVQNNNNNKLLQNSKYLDSQKSLMKKLFQKEGNNKLEKQQLLSQSLETDFQQNQQPVISIIPLEAQFNNNQQHPPMNQMISKKSPVMNLLNMTHRNENIKENNQQDDLQKNNEIGQDENCKNQDRIQNDNVNILNKEKQLYGENLNRNLLQNQKKQIYIPQQCQKQMTNNKCEQQESDNNITNQSKYNKYEQQQQCIIMSTLFPEEFEDDNEIFAQQEEDLDLDNQVIQNQMNSQKNNHSIKLTQASCYKMNSINGDEDEQIQNEISQSSYQKFKLSKSLDDN